MMTAEQEIKRNILCLLRDNDEEIVFIPDPIKDEDIEDLYERAGVYNLYYDDEEEFRCCGEPTGVECDYSRHYESESVGIEVTPGVWVGWTYWSGGGKHGEPESVEWMNDAYYLDITGEEVVTKYTFKKRQENE